MPGFDPHTHLRPPLANVPGGKPYVLVFGLSIRFLMLRYFGG